MPLFTQQPQIFSFFQWQGDMTALHVWLDPLVAESEAQGALASDFAIDTDPDTGDLRFLQWGYFFYARQGDWMTWTTIGGINAYSNTMDNTPDGFVPFTATVPEPVAGFRPPVPVSPQDGTFSTSGQPDDATISSGAAAADPSDTSSA